MSYQEKTRKFKNSKEKSSLTNARRVNNNTRIKHEGRFFNQIQFVVVLSWHIFYLFHIILQLNNEGLTLRLASSRSLQTFVPIGILSA